ncbi:3-keto-5-aminohexanoate cleavage protein [Microbacterium sp. 22215]|uniref:3-keto-5-aminohexanoate cleavage protein n=1 Tax=Microbacterium sp. 22215 TaxID=3453893 RepID=UPI003F846DF5
MSVILTVATTGPIATKADNPSLPTQPEEIASAVVEAYERGASVAHIHVRDENDRPTADLQIARRIIGLIQDRCPILIQLSTGVGLTVPFEEREALVELRPAMATLNPCTMSFGAGEFRNAPADVERLARRMQELEIKPELEVYDTGHLEECLRLRDRGLITGTPQFSLVLGVRGGMAATAENLITMVKRLPDDAIWQVIAIGRSNLELTAIGLALGGNARAGLEDTIYLGKGKLAEGNNPLVERAARLATDLNLSIADHVEAAQRLLTAA